MAYCVQVPNANYVAGQGLSITQCSGAGSQIWVQIGRTLRPAQGKGLCMDMNGLTASNQVPLATCDGSASQDFTWQPTSKFYRFVEKGNPGICMNIAGTSSPGSPITNAACNKVSYRQDISEASFITNRAVTLSYPESPVFFDGGATPMVAGTNITLQSASTDPNSISWQPTLVGDAYSYIAAYQPALALDANTRINASPIIVNTYASLDSQLFYKWTRSLTWTLSAAPMQCIAAASMVPSVGTAVVIEPCSGAPNQQWTLMPDRSFQNAGLCLDMVGQAAVANVAMQLTTCDFSGRQQWGSNGDYSGNVVYFNKGSPSFCVDTNGTSVAGSPLTLQTCGPSAYQRFTFY